MENENFSASKANEPLMSQNNQAQLPHQHLVKTPVVAVVEEDESKKKFLPQNIETEIHYKKDVHQVEIKQTQKFIGLTQEELQRYANDPFWRRLRLALFVLFWLAWILMFVIAIVLVVTSKKCPPKPERHWWQKQLCYQTYTRTFKDSNNDGIGDFKGMKEKIYDISRSHIQTIWPVPVLKSTNFTGYDVTDFTEVDERLGTLEEFLELINAAHEHQMYVIIDLPSTASTNSTWFFESEKSTNTQYKDYFHWLSAPPNKINWKESDKRQQAYYINENGWPVLNWNSPSLRTAMKEVIRKWIDRGIDAFYLGNVELMGLTSDYQTDWNLVNDRVKELRLEIDTYKNETKSTKQIAIFTSLPEDKKGDASVKTLLTGDDGVHYILNTELTKVDDQCDSACIRNHLINVHQYHKTNNETWPVWEIGNPYKSRVASRFGKNREKAELLQMLLFMLDGSINTYYGDELGMVDADVNKIKFLKPESFAMRSPMQWDGSENAGFSDFKHLSIPVNDDYASHNMKDLLSQSASSAKLYRKMAEWRMNDEAFLYGELVIAPPHPYLVGVLRKAYSESTGPNYYAVMNFANTTVNFNLIKEFNVTLPSEKSELSVGIMTSNLANSRRYRNRDVIAHKNHEKDIVILEPYTGIVFKYK